MAMNFYLHPYTMQIRKINAKRSVTSYIPNEDDVTSLSELIISFMDYLGVKYRKDIGIDSAFKLDQQKTPVLASGDSVDDFNRSIFIGHISCGDYGLDKEQVDHDGNPIAKISGENAITMPFFFRLEVSEPNKTIYAIFQNNGVNSIKLHFEHAFKAFLQTKGYSLDMGHYVDSSQLTELTKESKAKNNKRIVLKTTKLPKDKADALGVNITAANITISIDIKESNGIFSSNVINKKTDFAELFGLDEVDETKITTMVNGKPKVLMLGDKTASLRPSYELELKSHNLNSAGYPKIQYVNQEAKDIINHMKGYDV
jgi:hypothetical protein